MVRRLVGVAVFKLRGRLEIAYHDFAFERRAQIHAFAGDVENELLQGA